MRAIKLYTIQDVAQICEAKRTHLSIPDVPIHTLAFDSRKLHHVQHSLFFCLPGIRDGHDFIAHAYEQGVRQFVVSNWFKWPAHLPLEQVNVLEVDQTLVALQDLAAHHRRQFQYPVIAITGSNGKTVVKDWLFQLLSPDHRIIRSPKSYNSQLGVALSLWEMDAHYDLALIEAGISQVGEMHKLAEIIQPDLAIFTNIGAAHQEGFSNLTEKASEKWKLLAQAPQRVATDTLRLLVPAHDPEPTWWWGYGEGNALEIQALEQRIVNGRALTRISARLNRDSQHAPSGTNMEIEIPFTDSASIENACTCWVTLLCLGMSPSEIAKRMRKLQVMEMRLQLKQGMNQCSIIDDTYSNDMSSLAIALDFLREQRQHPNRTLILSDLPQITGQERRVYGQVAELLKGARINRLITVGPELAARVGLMGVAKHQVYLTTEDLLHDLPNLPIQSESILLKGARAYGFERVSARLVAQSHETCMEINMSALESNVLRYKSMLDPQVKLMVMVKAFSYGSGAFEVASRLQFLGVDYLAVAYADEGVSLRQAGITLPIMVMNPDLNSFDAIYEHALEPELYSFRILRAWMSYLGQKRAHRYPVHLKVDTGMHRLGFNPDEAEDLAQLLCEQEGVQVKSVFSHLASSGNPTHDEFTRTQIKRLRTFAAALRERTGQDFLVHIANTEGMMRFREANLDMVRLGIGLYGLSADAERMGLTQVIRLKTSVSQLRWVKAGESVSYNLRGVSSNDRLIATVRIGYADGYDRRFGNGVGSMRVQGQLVPTVGDVCMDMCMLDVTALQDHIQEGEEVWVYDEVLDVSELAGRIGTIPYELLVSISQRVKRVYYYG